MKSGFIGIIGRPNVGKSTLVNSIVGEKIAITSNKPGTTRNLIQGIYTTEDVQMVFVDTPGIHKPTHKLGNKLNAQAYYSIDDVDVLLLVMDVHEKLGTGDAFVINKLNGVNKPVILVLNKIDTINNDQLLQIIDKYKDIYPFTEIVPLSALKNNNIDTLIKVLTKYLPDSVKYFNEEDKTSSSIEFRICECVREKILRLTDDEVPYSITCILNDMVYEKDIYNIYVDIIVDRESIKKIIIGKQGSKLKEIGTKAREDLENILGKKVYLELYVKTLKKWRDKDKLLKELGFDEINE